ncbi:MAG: HEAT repeat domain-containing protein [Pirellulales bacterium]|nr:HEAT repeat domain-containing protein [Pirellulales bacterium]
MRMLIWPLLVVFVLTAVWVVLRSFTTAPPDVNSAIQAIHRDGNTPWRAAILLEALRQPSGIEMRADPAMARRVSELLEHELDNGSGEESATTRTYLCRALAQFEVDDGLPVLLRVVKKQTDEDQADERRTAIEAVASLTRHIESRRLATANRDLIPSLLEAADSPNSQVRAAAAYALGVFSAGDMPTLESDIASARAKLRILLHDVFADVRYNAATGLARSGNAACEEVLLEMLDPRESAASDPKSQETILLSALAASEQLLQKNPNLDTRRIKKAVTRLSEGNSDVSPEARRRAGELIERWSESK